MSWLSKTLGININVNKALGLETPQGQALEGALIGNAILPGIGGAIGSGIASGGQDIIGAGGTSSGTGSVSSTGSLPSSATSLESELVSAFTGGSTPTYGPSGETLGALSIPQTLQDIGNSITNAPANIVSGISNTLAQERAIVLSDTANIGIYIVLLTVAFISLWALLAPSSETDIQIAGDAAKVAAG